MRASEFIVESEIKPLKVGDTTIGVHQHSFDRSSFRDVTPTSVDIVLRQLPKVLDQIHQLQPGSQFYITDTRFNVSLGFRYTGSGKIILMTVIPTSQPYARGDNPVFKVNE
jgi:hypothetical protein